MMDVRRCNSRCTETRPNVGKRTRGGFTSKQHPNAKHGTDKHAGFPTLFSLPVRGMLKAAGVKVFDRPSSRASVIVTVNPDGPILMVRVDDEDDNKDSMTDLESDGRMEMQALESIARMLVGKIVYIDWPYLVECRVVGVSNQKARVTQDGVEHVKDGDKH